MKVTQEQITLAFATTKRTSNKVIANIKEVYDAIANKFVYYVDMEDGTKYIYCYEQTAQHNYSYAPKYYNRIIKIK